jgi:hypothetical protein
MSNGVTQFSSVTWPRADVESQAHSSDGTAGFNPSPHDRADDQDRRRWDSQRTNATTRHALPCSTIWFETTTARSPAPWRRPRQGILPRQASVIVDAPSALVSRRLRVWTQGARAIEGAVAAVVREGDDPTAA